MTKGKKNLHEALENWEVCNDMLRAADEKLAKELLELEKAGKCRIQYVLRIHARFNRMRAKRERAALLGSTGG